MAVSLNEPMAGAGRRDVEALEIDLLLDGLARFWGYDFRQYARASLVRRIRKIIQYEALPSVSALQERLLRDARAMNEFVEKVGVHTTAMFRDPDFYLSLRREVVPLLKTYPFVRIWHAGCATGEEVYSLAILLQEEGLYERSRLYATDLSDGVLERARKGIFPLPAMREYTTAYQAAGGRQEFSSYYMADQKSAIFKQALRANIIFAQHNLAADGVFNEFHLVLCRNVGIYFDEELRARMHKLIYQSLVPLGVMGLGKKESLRYTEFQDRYQELPGEVRLYRKLP
jgi:chemotaxis protein methyltransferase CheR